MKTIDFATGLEVRAPISGANAEVLSPAALDFLVELHREFNPRRLQLLGERKLRQEAIDRGIMPHFPPETTSVREGDWRVLAVPEDLRDRRVEITGPVD